MHGARVDYEVQRIAQLGESGRQLAVFLINGHMCISVRSVIAKPVLWRAAHRLRVPSNLISRAASYYGPVRSQLKELREGNVAAHACVFPLQVIPEILLSHSTRTL